MAANEYAPMSMNFRRVERVLFEECFSTEGPSYDRPWRQSQTNGEPTAPELGPLRFPRGNYFFDRNKRTLAFTYEPFDSATGGLPLNPNGEESIHYVARKWVASLPAGTQVFRVEHDLPDFFPVVQVYQRNIINRWYVVDFGTIGGTIEQDLTTFGGLGGDILIDFGAVTTDDAIAILIG